MAFESWLPGRGRRRAQQAAPSAIDAPGSTTNDQPPPTETEGVRGERTVIASVSREQSIQSRVNNIVAIATLILIGGGFLLWYYSATLAQHRAAEEAAKQAAANRAGAQMKLPPLPRLDPPKPVEAALGPPPELPKASAAPQGAQGPSPEELALQRKLKSPVLFAGTTGSAAPAAQPSAMPVPVGATAELPSLLSLSGAVGSAAAPGAGADLAGRLQPTATAAVSAQRLPTTRYLLPKGAFIDCTLETALDSTLPGMTTCITAVDTFGADGQVVLLERGTKLVGETRGDTKQGQARVFVLWTEARTPNGVVVQLASPGTDALGRSGLPGAVDTHFWDRFGAAILLSLVDGAVQAAVTHQSGGNGPSVIYNPQGARDIMTEVLRNTVNIAPTVVMNQGERIQVLVARDADFRSVYALRVQP